MRVHRPGGRVLRSTRIPWSGREEDTDDEIVYRSASSGYDFPRSRGREALELHPDGSYGGVVPGPADKPEASAEGTWKVEDGNKLVLPDRTLEITFLEPGAQAYAFTFG